MMTRVSVVKINAITVPADSGDELARRFAARAGAVDDQDGFEGFELLKPTDGRTTWLVLTRWRDEASFEAWLHSPAFAHGHQSRTRRRLRPGYTRRPSPTGTSRGPNAAAARPSPRSASAVSCGPMRSPAAPAADQHPLETVHTGITHTVISNSSESAWPITRRLDELLTN